MGGLGGIMKITQLLKDFPKNSEITLSVNGELIAYVDTSGTLMFKAVKEALEKLNDSKDLSKRSKIRKWYALSKTKNVKECVKALCGNYISKKEVYNFWPEAKHESAKKNQEIIATWNKNNPNGNMALCSKELGLSLVTVSRWFNLEKELKSYVS